MTNNHVPVMLKESIDQLKIKENGIYIDCTFGSGSHSKEILHSLGKLGKLISFDCDENVSTWKSEIDDERFFFINDNFVNFKYHLEKMGIKSVDGFIFDLGLSSMQLDSLRGFSYRKNSVLDMRMDTNSTLTAEQIINKFSVKDLADIFFLLGGEKKSYRLANEINYHRKKNKIVNSEDLVRIISGTLGKNKNKSHPAKKIFQSLRIKVNNELENLSLALNYSLDYLSEFGRVVVISYHSLEDRIVKLIFKERAIQNKSFFILNKKPILPTLSEIEVNRKARSAKMRVITKVNF